MSSGRKPKRATLDDVLSLVSTLTQSVDVLMRHQMRYVRPSDPITMPTHHGSPYSTYSNSVMATDTKQVAPPKSTLEQLDEQVRYLEDEVGKIRRAHEARGGSVEDSGPSLRVEFAARARSIQAYVDGLSNALTELREKISARDVELDTRWNAQVIAKQRLDHLGAAVTALQMGKRANAKRPRRK